MEQPPASWVSQPDRRSAAAVAAAAAREREEEEPEAKRRADLAATLTKRHGVEGGGWAQSGRARKEVPGRRQKVEGAGRRLQSARPREAQVK